MTLGIARPITVVASADLAKWSTLSVLERSSLEAGVSRVLTDAGEMYRLATTLTPLDRGPVADMTALLALSSPAHADAALVTDIDTAYWYDSRSAIAGVANANQDTWVSFGIGVIGTSPPNAELNPTAGSTSWNHVAEVNSDDPELNDSNVSASTVATKALADDIATLVAGSGDPFTPIVTRINADTSVTATDFVRNAYSATADISGGDIEITFDEGLADNTIIRAAVHVKGSGTNLTLVAGDGLTEKFRSNRGVVSGDGKAQIGVEGYAEYVKRSDYWEQYAGVSYSMLVTPYVQGYSDYTDPYVLRLFMSGASEEIGPFTDWTYELTFLHPAQSGRVITIVGDDLGAVPDTVNDTALIITDVSTSVFIGNDNTLIGGVSTDNGDTVTDVSGNLEAIDLISSGADLYGDIDIKISVVNGASQTVERVL